MCIDCLYADDTPDPHRRFRFIATDVALTLIRPGDTEREVVAVFEWDEVDPWAVTIGFNGVDPWVLDRELLKIGLHYDAGKGDVRFYGDVLHPGRRLMILDSPSGRAVYRFDPIEVDLFVADVDRHIRLAAEQGQEK